MRPNDRAEKRKTHPLLNGGWVFCFLLSLLIAGNISAQVTIQEAVDLYRQGRYHEARQQFLDLLEEHPKDADVLFYLAELEPSADRALEYRQQFLSLYPQHERADQVLYGVAQYNFALGYYLTAAKDYQQLLRTYPGSALRAEAYYWLASSKLAIGAADSAAVYFRKVIDQHAASSMSSWAEMGLVDAYYIQQDLPRAKSGCQAFLQTYSQSPLIPVALFRLAEICDAQGEREKAIETFGQLVRDYPDTYQGKEAQRQLTEWDWPDKKEQRKAPAHGNYTIQVGAFSKRENALNLEGQLRSWGYSVEVVKRAGQHRTLYLVWIGHYQTREEAIAAAKNLERDRGLPFQIIQR